MSPNARKPSWSCSRASPISQESVFRSTKFPTPFLWFDENGGVIDANEGACLNLGYDYEELMTKCMADIDPNFPRERWPSHWEEITKRGKMIIESVHRTKDGRRYPVEIVLHNQEFRDKRYNCVFARDIAERKRMEDNLKKYQNIVSSTLDAIAFLDEGYRYVIVNGAYERFSGTERERFIGSTVAEYLGEEVFRRFVKPNFDRCVQGETVAYREWFDYPTLGRRFVKVTYFPYRDDCGRIAGVVANTRDVTEEKLAEDALRISEERLKDAQRIANIGDWFWEVGSGSAGWSDQVYEIFQAPRSQPSYEFAESFVHPEDLERWRGTVRKAVEEQRPFSLDYRAVRSDGEIVWVHNETRLLFDERGTFSGFRGTVQDVTERISAQEALKELNETLEQKVAERTALAVARSRQLQALAVELVETEERERFALRVELETNFSEEIHVSLKTFLFRAAREFLFNTVKHAEADSAKVEVFVSGGDLVLTVGDEGRGFDPTGMEPKNGKDGLGLFSIRERADYIGGSLAIESAPGEGSRFTLKLPLNSLRVREPRQNESPTESKPGSPAEIADESKTGLRVLFADDPKVVRQGLVRLISSNPGIAVAGEAENGREAVEKARLLKPDVILMDVSMPEMDGIEATRRIKAEMPEARVIGLSMHADEKISEAMRKAGAESFLSKTASPAELLKAIYGDG